MLVVNVPTPGGPEALTVAERPRPSPRAGEVLIEVAAAGVNRADVLQRQGHYPPPAGVASWPGLEVSGTVVEVGTEVDTAIIGQSVCALLPGGGYAQYALARASHTLPVPPGVSVVDAAGIMEVACTVWSNLDALGASDHHRILIQGGSGGVGSWAIQVAHARGMWVATTAGGPERVARCLELGADLGIDHHQDDAVAQVGAAGGVDLILDILGGGALGAHLEILRPGGAMAVIGLQQGAMGTLPLGLLLSRSLTVIGTTLRGRTDADKDRIVAGVRAQVWPLIPAQVAPVIHATVPLQDAANAHRMLEAGDVFGKVLLTA